VTRPGPDKARPAWANEARPSDAGRTRPSELARTLPAPPVPAVVPLSPVAAWAVDLRCRTNQPAATTIVASAANGKYIRRSAPTSLTIGTRLDVGASVRKNDAARKPNARDRASASAVAASNVSNTAAPGSTSLIESRHGR